MGQIIFKYLQKIFVPLAKPALITIALWAFMGTWNDLLGQLIYINDPAKYTIQLGLASFNSLEILWGPWRISHYPIIAILLYAQKLRV